jgi:RNA polymerase sigma factor (sigma-70 family)
MATTQVWDTYCFHPLYVQELEKGDAATTNHFVSYFRPRLQSFLRKNGAPADSVEDLQQETFVRVLAALQSKGIRHPERLGGFVNAVCRNTLLELFRSTRRYIELDDSISELLNDGTDPNVGLLAAEDKGLVWRIVSRLSPRDQKLLQAVFVEQKSKAEICEELGVSRAHLRLLFHRAKHHFLDHMAKNERRHFQRQCQ